MAEEVIFGADHVTSGASSDFEQATQVCACWCVSECARVSGLCVCERGCVFERGRMCVCVCVFGRGRERVWERARVCVCAFCVSVWVCVCVFSSMRTHLRVQ